MDTITTNRQVQAQFTPAPAEKPGNAPTGSPASEPHDEFTPLRPEPEIHSLKDYGSNIADSSKIGFAAGFCKVGGYVEQFMPSYDGLDHPGKHLLCAIPPILAGAIGGVAGAGVGLAMGLFGQNIGTHVSQHDLGI